MLELSIMRIFINSSQSSQTKIFEIMKRFPPFIVSFWCSINKAYGTQSNSDEQSSRILKPHHKQKLLGRQMPEKMLKQQQNSFSLLHAESAYFKQNEKKIKNHEIFKTLLHLLSGVNNVRSKKLCLMNYSLLYSACIRRNKDTKSWNEMRQAPRSVSYELMPLYEANKRNENAETTTEWNLSVKRRLNVSINSKELLMQL